MSDEIKLFDVVALTVDLPEYNLARGQVGTVVELLKNGAAYEVEFSHRPRTRQTSATSYRQSHQSRSESVHQSMPIGWPSGGSFGLVRFIFLGSS